MEQKKYNIEDVCLGCLVIYPKMKSHPIYKGGICSTCVELLKNAITGNDTDTKSCIICGVLRDSVHCYNETCQGVFCKTCIGEFFPPNTWSEILRCKAWACFLCYTPTNMVYLIKNVNWEFNLLNLFRREVKNLSLPASPKPLRVLSLFDGIGAGYVALQNLGLVIGEYFSSEIDEAAMIVSQVNSKGKIRQLGDVRSITINVLRRIWPIDILIGGSPCTELSLVNPARRGLFDINTSGVLFFEYIRILRELEFLNNRRPILFLYENTAAMPKTFRDTISRFFGSDPILQDAKYFGPMKRARLFWGNIPGMDDRPFIPNPSVLRLDSYLTEFCNRTSIVSQLRTITTNSNSLRQGSYRVPAVLMNGNEDCLWINEIEKIFGFKEHYTDIGNLNTNKRLALIGSSWCIPVICHLLRRLAYYFETKTE